MSKLDRELDEVHGEKRVSIYWPSSEDVDVDEIRKHLLAEIDLHEQRIPLDLRSVQGAPQPLIDLLLECQVYARSNGKTLVISSALPAMQDALNGKRRRKKKKETDPGAAGDSAKSVLEKQLQKNAPSTYDISSAEKLERANKRNRRIDDSRSRNRRRRYSLFAGVIVLATTIVGVIEWYVIFRGQPSSVSIPTKTFEERRIDEPRPQTRQPEEPRREERLPVGDEAYRTWNDVSGKFEIEAVLAKIDGTTIHLRTQDGQSIKVDRARLSEEDRKYLDRLEGDNPFVVE